MEYTMRYRIVPNQRTGAPKVCQNALGIKSCENPSRWIGHVAWSLDGWLGLNLDGARCGPPRETQEAAAIDVLTPGGGVS